MEGRKGGRESWGAKKGGRRREWDAWGMVGLKSVSVAGKRWKVGWVFPIHIH